MQQSLLLKTIKQYLLDQDILQIDEEIDKVVVWRAMADLNDYIFDLDSFRSQSIDEAEQHIGYDVDSLKRFDYLDFVIMDVDPSVLPWQKKSK